MGSNNFFLNQDPLLFASNQYNPLNGDDFRQQMNDSYNQYKLFQQKQQKQQIDYLSELDRMMKNVSNDTIAALNNNKEYKRLNNELNNLIQTEIMDSVKWKINNNPDAVKNIERQKELIEEANTLIENEKQQSLNELNDYVKNYSNITFDEYKKIKNGEKPEIKTKKVFKKNNNTNI